MENVVYNHLVFKGYKVLVGTLGTKEIDFVAEKDGEKLYLQVALSLNDEATLAREFGNLKQIKANYGPERPGDGRHSKASIAKLEKFCGYSPKFKFKEGLEIVYGWYV